MLGCSSQSAVQCPNVECTNPFSWRKKVTGLFAMVALGTQGKKIS